jgi:hypothetical protein
VPRIHKPKPDNNSNKKSSRKSNRPYVCKHWNIACIVWCANRTRLDIAVVDDAMVALTTFDSRFSVGDRELAQHVIDAIGLDQLSARRFVRALRESYSIQLKAYTELLQDDEPDCAS